jgi:hypothetical protein
MLTAKQAEELLKQMGGNASNCVCLGAKPEVASKSESLASLKRDLKRAENPYSYKR